MPRPCAYDPRAASLLDGLELRDRDNAGLREDASGRPVRFAVLVQSGITSAQTAMSFMRDALANVGVGVDIVALDKGGVIAPAGRRAVRRGVPLQFRRGHGSGAATWISGCRRHSHLWHPGQKTPATPWEAEIDRRMLLVASTMDQAARVREFAEVQRLMLTHNLAMCFAVSRVFVATGPRVGGVVPRLTRPQILWRADELYVVN